MKSNKHAESSLIAKSVAIIMPCVGIAFFLWDSYGLHWVILFCVSISSTAHFVSVRYRRLSEQGKKSVADSVSVDAGSVLSTPDEPSKEE